VIPLRGRGQAAAAGLPGFLPEAPGGRVFAVSRAVRSTEVTPAGRLRFDALARYLQDAAEDDMADAGFPEPHVWLLRRCAVAVRGYPAHGERVTLRTFCSAIGPRWAERTTTVTGPGGDLMQARAVWAAIAPDTGRPVPLGQAFHRLFGAAAQGRYVSARLTHPGPGPRLARAGRPWPLRASDFDTVGHVNNAVHWAAVEDVLAGCGWLPSSAEIEYQRPILPGCRPELVTSNGGGRLDVWLTDGTRRLASARLAR